MTQQPSILGGLRSLRPTRAVTFEEALRIAELQATRLHSLIAVDDSIRESDVASLPRIRVAYESIPTSGMSHWNGREWVITINRSELWTRQRFTLLHELKHLIDHGSTAQLYTGSRAATSAEQAERAADYFAGCALLPKRLLKAAWGSGVQRPTDLAELFGLSREAVVVRLAQTGLSVDTDRPPQSRCTYRQARRSPSASELTSPRSR